MRSIFNIISKAHEDILHKSVHCIPKKALGQNFLKEKDIAKKIVSYLDNVEGMTIIEIGAGAGALTHFLQEKENSLYIIEKDPYWAGVHSKSVPVVCMDALFFAWEKIHSNRGCRYCLIGNLPYNIASSLIWDIVSQADVPAVFMVQKEVGERLCAKEGTKLYGALSVWVQSFVKVKKECIVPPTAFFPRPKIDSMVLSFTPFAQEKRELVPKELKLILEIIFQQRRKQLQGVLKKYYKGVESVFEECGFLPKIRGEALSVKDIHMLTKALYKKINI
ncbi:MAG: 16S rRNA (adenine(1518)-N(6)/adenine(1519)-N(6))-dimethyltransferase RsmA [Desulfovibrionaceae bacterium]